MNNKQELINFLLDSLPNLSNYINQIVTTMPRNIEDMDPDHIKTIRPKVRKLLSFIKKNVHKVKPSINLHKDDELSNKDDELSNIYNLYFEAISDILDGVEKLYTFLLDEEEATEENIEVFIEKLFKGSIGITKLVEKITE